MRKNRLLKFLIATICIVMAFCSETLTFAANNLRYNNTELQYVASVLPDYLEINNFSDSSSYYLSNRFVMYNCDELGSLCCVCS